jgi:hypothetical protein
LVRLEPSSFALTVAVWATVEDVSVAVYVPSRLFVVAQFVVQAPGNVPAVVDTVTVPPLAARFVLLAFFSWTVIVDVEVPLAVIGLVPLTVEVERDAGAVFVTAVAARFAARLPALSWSLFVAGWVYATVTLAPPKMRVEVVRTTDVALATETFVTVQLPLQPVTVKALVAGVMPVLRPLPASVYVSVTCVPRTLTAEDA